MTLTNNNAGEGDNTAFYESLAKLSPADQAHVMVHIGIGARVFASQEQDAQSGSVEVNDSGELVLVQEQTTTETSATN